MTVLFDFSPQVIGSFFHDVEFIISQSAPFFSFLFDFYCVCLFKSLHGRTSLSGLSHTLPQFGIIWSLPVIHQVTCLVIWQMLRRSYLVLYSQWLVLALGHEWNQKIRQVCLMSSFWVKTYTELFPSFMIVNQLFSGLLLLTTSPLWFQKAQG